MMGRTVIVAAAVAVIGAGAVFWWFGTPQTSQVAQRAAVAPLPAGGPAEAVPFPGAGMPGVPSMGSGDPSARGKKAPAPDPNSPLAVRIPGCRCHSDDPKLVEEHAQYRMNQCFGCHTGGRGN